MTQNEEAERKAAIEEFATDILDGIDLGDDDGKNLGSEEQYPVLSFDEWAIDEVNEILNESGLDLTIDHGQVFLNKL